MDSRMKRAHAQRVAQALAGQWPAHFGVTRQDVVASASFVAMMSCIAWCWVGQSPVGTAADIEVPRIVTVDGVRGADTCKGPES